MHHDSRTYIEFRFDSDTCDCVIVNFRNRGILPTEVITWEYSFESPYLGDDMTEEVKALVNKLWLELYNDK